MSVSLRFVGIRGWNDTYIILFWYFQSWVKVKTKFFQNAVKEIKNLINCLEWPKEKRKNTKCLITYLDML